MNNAIKEYIVKQLYEVADRIKSDSCEMDESDIISLVHTISKVPMSKADACRYLDMSRTTFDYKVKIGEIPHGRKRRGFNELTWYR
jgi:hypothetical protein